MLAADGELLSRHGTAQEFCAALRQALSAAGSLEQMDALWARDRGVTDEMRVLLPDLRTARGSHYMDVLQRCYAAQRARLTASSREEVAAQTEPASVDKSLLSLGVPRRLRDADHLAFVCTLPCLVCARTPSEPHHLRFAQPRGLSSKTSDEWVVPLCLLHQRALHDAGSEERWWEEQRLDAKAEAERLWRQSHRPEPAGDRLADAAK